MSGLIVSPHDLNGHKSASQRREAALHQRLVLLDGAIRSLQAVLIVALEQRGGVPLIVLAERRAAILSGDGAEYRVEQDESGNVTYSLPTNPAAVEVAPASSTEEPT